MSNEPTQSGRPRALYRNGGTLAEVQAELEALAAVGETIGRPSIERVVDLLTAGIVARAAARKVFIERAVGELLALAQQIACRGHEGSDGASFTCRFCGLHFGGV